MKLLHVMPQSACVLETLSTFFARFPSFDVYFFPSVTQVSVLRCFVSIQRPRLQCFKITVFTLQLVYIVIFQNVPAQFDFISKLFLTVFTSEGQARMNQNNHHFLKTNIFSFFVTSQTLDLYVSIWLCLTLIPPPTQGRKT